ncbi:hypothetical protein JCM3765_006574 [Sporobolomyces pararoseus]
MTRSKKNPYKKNLPTKKTQGRVPSRDRPLQNFNKNNNESITHSPSLATTSEIEENINEEAKEDSEVEESKELQEEGKKEMTPEEWQDELTLKEREELLREKKAKLARLEWKMFKLKGEIKELETMMEESRK